MYLIPNEALKVIIKKNNIKVSIFVSFAVQWYFFCYATFNNNWRTAIDK